MITAVEEPTERIGLPEQRIGEFPDGLSERKRVRKVAL